jgi:8-oxo-dGTP pyrophosphatase MutT (NUDIX family)
MEENPWITKSKEIKYENPWIKVVENQVINPAGKDGIYGVVHFKNTAIAIIPLDEEYNTWIVGQYRYTLDSFEWEVPEGGSLKSEAPLDGAKRELAEETGYEASEYIKVLEMQLSNSVSDEVSVTYVAKGLTFIGDSPEETEKIYVKKLPFQELFEMTMRGEIRDGLSVASILKVKLMIELGQL